MRPYIISTDSTADLPADFVKKNNITVLPLYVMIDDVTYAETELPFSEKEFYDKMREGAMPTTMALNPELAKTKFQELVDEGYDIMHIAFSSGLSSTCNNAEIAAREVMEENPGVKICVIDSLGATLGEGLLVYYANKKREEGLSFEALKSFLEDFRFHIGHHFTVDDLFHLHRGGRVSKATAVIGTIAQIKPVLHMDDNGKLINIGKARGRKRSLQNVADNMQEAMGSLTDTNNEIVCICHSDCLEDAQYLADEIKKRWGFSNFMFSYIGCTIGAHTGPGTVAVFFVGDHR